MRAPDTDGSWTPQTLRSVFSDKQWKQIAKSLADVDIDFDAETRVALQDTALHFAMLARLPGGLPTPKQQATELREALAAFERALVLLPVVNLADDSDDGYDGEDAERIDWTRVARIENSHALSVALTNKVGELRNRIAKLETMGSASAESAGAGAAREREDVERLPRSQCVKPLSHNRGG